MRKTERPSLRGTFAALVVVGVAAACGDAGDEAASGAAGTLEGPDVLVDAVTEEVLTVGSVTGDGWDAFGRVSSVHFDDQANLHIFDSQASHFHVVGPDGSLVRTVGGEGDGPGEFGRVSSAIVGRDGSYTVLGILRIDLLDSGGEFVRSVSMDPMTGIMLRAMALPDGRLVSETVTPPPGEQSDETGRPIHVLALDGTAPQVLYTAWEMPEAFEFDNVIGGTPESGMRMRMPAGRAFEPGLEIDVLTDGRIAVIDSIGYRVKLIGPDGSVAGAVERPIAPLPVDDAIMEAERERFRVRREDMTGAFGADLPFQLDMEGADDLAFADEVPVLSGLKVDWDGRIWIQRRGPTGAIDGPIDIVTPDGEYVGTLPSDGLRTPDAFGPGGLMAYIETDELDVPTVRVMRLLALEPRE